MTIPKTTKSRARNMTAPLPQLPPLHSHFGGELTFAQSVEHLEHLFFTHWSLMRVLAGVLIRIPDIETKVFLAHSLYLHSEVASVARRRLIELRVRESKLHVIPDSIDTICNELLYCDTAAELVFGYSAFINDIQERHSNYVMEANELLDRPSVTMLRRFEADFERTTEWLDTAQSAYLAVDPDSYLFGEHIMEIQKVGASEGSNMPPLRKASREPYRRTNECARDGRFSLFHQSRS